MLLVISVRFVSWYMDPRSSSQNDMAFHLSRLQQQMTYLTTSVPLERLIAAFEPRKSSWQLPCLSFKLQCSITLPSTSRYSMSFLLVTLSSRNLVHISLLPQLWHTLHSSQSPNLTTLAVSGEYKSKRMHHTHTPKKMPSAVTSKTGQNRRLPTVVWSF
jgi:hypothetical protein